MMLGVDFLKIVDYRAPDWCKPLNATVAKRRCHLGMLPTPVHRWHLPNLPPGVEIWIKRDDMSGMQLSGNKVRKLEFLMAVAVESGYDSVITLGGVQSNHCRATAVAAKYLGLDCHLILRLGRTEVDKDPGFVGNLLVDRLSGATIHTVTKEEYVQKGSIALGQQLKAQLISQGKNPYLIPVGGSNALGTWGYLEAVEELMQQQQVLAAMSSSIAEMSSTSHHNRISSTAHDGQAAGGQGAPFFTDIVMACGSGGTTAGLALGSHLSGWGARVRAYGVCDDPEYFYHYIDGLIADLWQPGSAESDDGHTTTSRSGKCNPPAAKDILRVIQARGAGYAISNTQELQTVKDIASATGVILDPVYSGKAMHALITEMQEAPEAWIGRKILFVHTGGLLGIYDKMDQISQLLGHGNKVERFVLQNS
ncbi:hypothetical protein CEUSTIGMA_g6360.t1 [Chlamydomonas eustigma]|uniref:Tryptophan synthase beta chain-like PALP domain-containing protein n=1 Tax=Chlamydomonas eustigma TaxID=1157962 RepID=A0A250X762_9CHLO|nr:hypothetical protein CEUSTIGMA_g6360.t1 [Chlamydomonas eustigma]|eukprot:GAX78921.1 hypothetical protein CEUSTIGMA_g6360.t1 [Chlamydomonas eustigma]